MPERRFPPPWSVEDPDPKLERQCYIVRDHNGQALAFTEGHCIVCRELSGIRRPFPRHDAASNNLRIPLATARLPVTHQVLTGSETQASACCSGFSQTKALLTSLRVLAVTRTELGGARSHMPAAIAEGSSALAYWRASLRGERRVGRLIFSIAIGTFR
jgi:hypothetical protein